jgi:hypothetical protein
MKLRHIIVLCLALLSISACIVDPIGGFRGGGERDYGHRAWRG